MKYVIDLDSLKECFDLLPTPFIKEGKVCVYLDTVKEMIDKFPKKEVKDEQIVYR